ncbi:hypothetical protein [Nocardia cyriacigeorgica]|uniref:hypothetical protein n=1 Tax=Nocardia cyriacigeorgica TaxID=135487 RepID=UPI0014869E93|nr:hypothetical protein [Nocardia cyriacigeorgica]
MDTRLRSDSAMASRAASRRCIITTTVAGCGRVRSKMICASRMAAIPMITYCWNSI